MKKIFSVLALLATIFTQSAFAQTSADKAPTALSIYYGVRDALTSGNTTIATAKAQELKSAFEGVKSLDLKTSLQKNAGLISLAKSIKTQREAFASLSLDMISLIKVEKLSTEPIYQVVCPMQNNSWLSSEKVVKNPYYGSAMLTCGKVVATL
ncbi:MAG TPA: DUF3347 domain-containing protein [Pedobacter sp.]|jgi:hypothetical protein